MNDMFEQLQRIAGSTADRVTRARDAAELIRTARGYRWVGVYDITASRVIALAWTGSTAPAHPTFPRTQGLTGAAVAARAPVIIQDVRQDPRYLTTFESTQAEAIFPVLAETDGSVIATIDVESERVNAFTPEDEAFLGRCVQALAPLWRGQQDVPTDRRSISAYDLPQRVASYDADMELMHPNRSKMVQVAIDVLPFSRSAPLRALDLGVGTGYFTQQFLNHYPSSHVLAIDGAAAMADLAQARLGALGGRVDFRVGDLRRLQMVAGGETFDVAFSSYTLHHLNRDEKEAVVRQALELLRPGGWFLNADVIVAESREMERRIQEIRVDGIMQRAGGADARFRDAMATRRFLDELEANEGDQPLSLLEDLDILRRSGVRDASVFWLEYREAVCGGWKS